MSHGGQQMSRDQPADRPTDGCSRCIASQPLTCPCLPACLQGSEDADLRVGLLQRDHTGAGGWAAGQDRGTPVALSELLHNRVMGIQFGLC